MTANINIQNKTVMPEQAKPVLKAVDHQSNSIQKNQSTVGSTTLNQTKDVSAATKTKPASAAKESSEQPLDSAVKQLNAYVQSTNRSIEFKIDKDSGRTVVTVTDVETDELIRQIPNKEALKIAKQLDEILNKNDPNPGILLFKERA